MPPSLTVPGQPAAAMVVNVVLAAVLPSPSRPRTRSGRWAEPEIRDQRRNETERAATLGAERVSKAPGGSR